MNTKLLKIPAIAMTAGALAFGMGTAATPAEAHAATNVKTVFNWFTKPLSTTKTIPDITGDGKNDKVRFAFAREGGDGTSSLTIYVNGKKAYRTTEGCGGYVCKVKRVTFKTGRPLVYVEYTGDNGDGVFALLRYEKGKLKKLADNNIADGLHHPYIDKIKFNGNAIDITYSNQPYGLGRCEFTYSYKYQKGTLKRTSSTASGLDYGSPMHNNPDNEKQPYLTLLTKTKFYSSPSSEASTVALPQDCRVKLTAVKKSGRQLWFKAEVENREDALWLKTSKTYLSHSKYPMGTYFKEKFIAG